MNELIENKNDTESFSDKEIFTKMWLSPRQVFKYINDNQYDKYVIMLLLFAGISRAFDRASMKNMGDDMDLSSIIGFCIIGGGLLGWLSYYIYAALLSWTGEWIGGQGDSKQLLRIMSYATFPASLGLILLIPQISIYGVEMYKANGDITSAGFRLNFIVYGSILLEIALAFWSLALNVIGISEVQKLSIGKAILNLFLPILVIVIPLVLIIFVFRLI